MPPPSRRISERYVLGPDLASGGMATVHLGKQLGSEGFRRIVALKRLHSAFSADAEVIDGFLAEARVASSIRHPSVVGIQDLVKVDDELFLVMDYVPGVSLSRLLALVATRAEGDRHIPPGIACAILLNTLDGLAAAHSATSDDGTPLGLIHRDVSPQNVLVGVDGTGRLIDFGVARSAMRLRATREAVVKGKLLYLPPEVIEGEPHGISGDVFGAGCVLWEALVGAPLFEAQTDGAIAARILVGDVAAPSTRAPNVPASLDAVVLRATAHAARRRFATAADFAAALRGAIEIPSAPVVRDWLLSRCRETLDERAALVRSFELEPIPDTATDVTRAITASIPAPRRSIASIPAMEEPPPARQSSRRWAIAMVFAAIGAFAVAHRLRASGGAEPPTAPTASSDSAAPSTLPSPAVSTTVEAGSASAATVIGGDAAGPVSAGDRDAAASTGRHPATPSTPGVDCRVPYRLDPDGNRIYKRECVR